MTKMLRLLLPALIAALAVPAPAGAQAVDRRGDQYDAYQARKKGRVRPLREIEGAILPRMRGADYLGPEYDEGSGSYRLKFMRGGRVIWVDVDGRTGAVLGRSGN